MPRIGTRKINSNQAIPELGRRFSGTRPSAARLIKKMRSVLRTAMTVGDTVPPLLGIHPLDTCFVQPVASSKEPRDDGPDGRHLANTVSATRRTARHLCWVRGAGGAVLNGWSAALVGQSVAGV